MRFITFVRTSLSLAGGGGYGLLLLVWLVGHLAITTGAVTPDMAVMDRYSIAAVWAILAHVGSLPTLGLALVAWPRN